MSPPFYKITCSGCDYEDGYSYAADYEYEGLDCHQPVLRPAWCQDCDKIVDASTPFTRDQAESEIADHNLWISRNQTGLFAKYSRKKKDEIRETEQEIGAVLARLAHFENMPYKSRCLACGGHNISPFYLPYGEYGVAEALDVTHKCGCHLMVSMEGRISFSSLKKITYDENGNILHRE